MLQPPGSAVNLRIVRDHPRRETPMSQLALNAIRARRIRAHLATLAVGGVTLLAACSDEPVAPSSAGGSFFPRSPFGAVAAPLGASVVSTVVVPASMQSSPFNTARTLKIPPNFTISVYARVSGA